VLFFQALSKFCFNLLGEYKMNTTTPLAPKSLVQSSYLDKKLRIQNQEPDTAISNVILSEAYSQNPAPEHIKKRFYTIQEVIQIGAWGRTKTYQLIGEGKLVAKKLGKKTLITAESLEELISSLPNKSTVGGK
jgi:hypothetical protein